MRYLRSNQYTVHTWLKTVLYNNDNNDEGKKMFGNVTQSSKC